MNTYAVIITELEEGTDLEKTISICEETTNLERALEIARNLKHLVPDGFTYKVAEIGTIYTI
jgi:hypothetical protein